MATTKHKSKPAQRTSVRLSSAERLERTRVELHRRVDFILNRVPEVLTDDPNHNLAVSLKEEYRNALTHLQERDYVTTLDVPRAICRRYYPCQLEHVIEGFDDEFKDDSLVLRVSDFEGLTDSLGIVAALQRQGDMAFIPLKGGTPTAYLRFRFETVPTVQWVATEINLFLKFADLSNAELHEQRIPMAKDTVGWHFLCTFPEEHHAVDTLYLDRGYFACRECLWWTDFEKKRQAEIDAWRKTQTVCFLDVTDIETEQRGKGGAR